MTKDTNGNNAAIVVQDIHKSFKLPHEQQSGLKQLLLGVLKHRRKRGYENQHVLKGVSFTINKGDFFGIVGRNGSGKSTLLKLLAGIYTPDKGQVEVNGSLTPFIELGVGFNPELTGRENVFLNGALLGFSHDEMSRMYDDIVEFAELKQFMDQKLKNYSSGMQVRLAFSIAIRAKSDILILDEVLAVGDEAFQRKCSVYFEGIRKDKHKTVILVTHSMENVRQYCNRAMLITDGEIKELGSPDKVANAYSDIFIHEQIAELEKRDEEKITNGLLSDVILERIGVVQGGKRTRSIEFHQDFSLEMAFSAKFEHRDLTMGIHIFDQSGRDMLAISTRVFPEFNLRTGVNVIKFNIQNIFTDGDYYINLAIEENDTKKLLVQQHEICHFSILGLNRSRYSKLSLTYPYVEMSVE